MTEPCSCCSHEKGEHDEHGCNVPNRPGRTCLCPGYVSVPTWASPRTEVAQLRSDLDDLRARLETHIHHTEHPDHVGPPIFPEEKP